MRHWPRWCRGRVLLLAREVAGHQGSVFIPTLIHILLYIIFDLLLYIILKFFDITGFSWYSRALCVGTQEVLVQALNVHHLLAQSCSSILIHKN